jgi:hypothetical protein
MALTDSSAYPEIGQVETARGLIDKKVSEIAFGMNFSGVSYCTNPFASVK